MEPNLPQAPPPSRRGDREPEGETRHTDWEGIQPLSAADTKRTFDHEEIWHRRFHPVCTSPNERDRIQRGFLRFARSLAIETGAIEGLYDLTPEVEEALLRDGPRMEHTRLMNPKHPALSLDDAIAQAHALFDVLWDHVKAHNMVLELAVEDHAITKHAIRELHALITAHQDTHRAVDSLGRRVDRKLRKGAFKIYPNNPRQPDGTVYLYAPPEQVELQLDLMLELYAEYREAHHPLLVGAWLHHRFIQIHPFADGNGRTGRMLLNWHLWRARWYPVSVHRKDRNRYLDAMNQADAGDLSVLTDFLIAMNRKAIRLVMHEFSVEERLRVLGSGV